MKHLGKDRYHVLMKPRAILLLNGATEHLRQAASDLQSLLDNPDDFELTVNAECSIRGLIGMLETLRDEVNKLAN